MGIQDRDYYRESNNDISSGQAMPVVYKIIILNAILWVANALFTPAPNDAITNFLALHLSDIYRPWLWWKFLTCGFAHAADPNHIIFNMLGLFFLGPYVEMRYGSKRFLGFYLASIIAGSAFWAFCSAMDGSLSDPAHNYSLIGASGGVTATVILFTITFPRVMLLFMFCIPMPAWVLGFFIVGLDFYGAYQSSKNPMYSNVAYTVHLASAAFAILYYRFNWSFEWLGNLFMGGFLSVPSSRNKYQIYDESDDEFGSGSGWTKGVTPHLRSNSSVDSAQREKDKRLEAELRDEVDRILRKITMTGRDSLTRAEERTLQAASEHFQNKK